MPPKLPRKTVTKLGPDATGTFYRFLLKPEPKKRERTFIVRSKKTGRAATVNTKDPQTRWYEHQISLATEAQHPIDKPFESDLTLWISFFMADRTHGDLDNLCKALMDGMQAGSCFLNDKQVKSLHAELIFLNSSDEICKTPRTEVIVLPHINRSQTPPCTFYSTEGEDF